MCTFQRTKCSCYFVRRLLMRYNTTRYNCNAKKKRIVVIVNCKIKYGVATGKSLGRHVQKPKIIPEEAYAISVIVEQLL